MAESVWLQRDSEEIPWGFRLQGGIDYHLPLTVQKVTPGSIASTGLSAGDVIVRISDTDTKSLTHSQAMQLIKDGGQMLQLQVTKSGCNASVTSPEINQQFSNLNMNNYNSYNNNPISSGSSYNNPISSGSSYNNPISSGSSYNNPISSGSSYNNPISSSSSYNNPISSGSSYNNPISSSYNNPTSNVNNSISSSGGTTTSAPLSPPPLDMYGFNNNRSQTSSLNSLHTNTSGYQSDTIDSYTPTPQNPTPWGQQQRMPDAVMNMAAKGDSTKKPFSYIADVNDIQQQRERVRRRPGGASLPKYQHMLNLPHFEDPPSSRTVHRTPPTTPSNSYSKTPMSPGNEPGIAHLQYNSPLDMYSGENVVESLQGQTGGLVKDVIGLPTKEKADIKDSAVYKMIHGIDQPQRRQKPVPQAYFEQPKESEEEKASEIDTSSIRPLLFDDVQDAGYDQQSIRYTGRNIPSKCFRLLQSMTGSDGNTLEVPQQQQAPPRRRVRRGPPPPGSAQPQPVRGYNEQQNNYSTAQQSNAAAPGAVPSEQNRAVKIISLRQQSQPSNDDVSATDF